MSEQKHTMTGKQPKRINIEKGVFESNGTFYYIYLDPMGFKRIKRFYEMIPAIAYGRKYTDLLAFIHGLKNKMLSGGDDFKKTFFDVATDLTNWDNYLIDNGGDFVEAHIDDTLRFCALFIVTKDEDMTELDDRVIEKKIADWKTDMAMDDFFLLARSQTPRFSELLATLWDEVQEKKLKELQSRTQAPT